MTRKIAKPSKINGFRATRVGSIPTIRTFTATLDNAKFFKKPRKIKGFLFQRGKTKIQCFRIKYDTFGTNMTRNAPRKWSFMLIFMCDRKRTITDLRSAENEQ